MQSALFLRKVPVITGLITGLAVGPGGLPLVANDTASIADYRTIDGSDNHPTVSDLGKAHSVLIRIAPADYGNDVDLPRGVPVEDDGDGNIEVDEQTELPSGRTISNLVHAQGSNDIPSERFLSQLFFQFGQFLSHDTGLTEPDANVIVGGATGDVGNESFPVEVEPGDPEFFIPTISLTRSVGKAISHSGTGIREQINTITAFIDASNVYGSTESRAADLRLFEAGKLLSDPGPDGPLMPKNTTGQPNANAIGLPATSLFLGGDVRANEQLGLIAIHTLFLREHNRLADEIAARDFPGADLTNAAVDEEIYQRARAVVAAYMQRIVYYEWLPTLLGFDAIPSYSGYNPAVNPEITNEFSSAAFRIGHTMLPPTYFLTAEDGTVTPTPLFHAFFQPAFVDANGIDEIIRGQARNRQQEFDQFVVDAVRNFLFGAGFGLDLASLNIQRGRDHGIPGYNAVRQAYGLPEVGDYDEFLGPPGVRTALQSAYGSGKVDDIDLWTAGLCEKHIVGTNLGETFSTIFIDQFTRLRDGDRFYFENRSVYSDEFIDHVHNTSFADIIQRNTNVDWPDLNEYSFFVPGYHPFQGDLRIGTKRRDVTHVGDDIYNLNALHQRIRENARNGRAKFFLSLENDGAFMNPTKTRVDLRGRRDYKLRLIDLNGPRRNVTASMMTDRYVRTPAPKNIRLIKVRVVARGDQERGNTKLRFRSECVNDDLAVDSTLARIRLRG